MKERGIPFKGWLVRAILEDRKGITRRLQGLEEVNANPNDWTMESMQVRGTELYFGFVNQDSGRELEIRCPYGKPEDHLWVRENFARSQESALAFQADGACGSWMRDGGGARIWWPSGWLVGFTAPGKTYNGGWWPLSKFGGKWTPSIHMPRWASRVTLEVTGVRVERLKDITESDAKAEGISTSVVDPWPREPINAKQYVHARDVFLDLWTVIYGIESTDANPWVWVISFRRLKQPRAWKEAVALAAKLEPAPAGRLA